jgi:hypothetical protein
MKMNAFEVAKKFYHQCETGTGWDGCKDFIAEGATFQAQCEPLSDIASLHDYTEWLADFIANIAPDAKYEKHVEAFDENSATATFFSTFHGTHSGDGGPVPATFKRTHSQYVYVIKMNSSNKVEALTKIWNPTWSSNELGWI